MIKVSASSCAAVQYISFLLLFISARLLRTKTGKMKCMYVAALCLTWTHAFRHRRTFSEYSLVFSCFFFILCHQIMSPNEENTRYSVLSWNLASYFVLKGSLIFIFIVYFLILPYIVPLFSIPLQAFQCHFQSSSLYLGLRSRLHFLPAEKDKHFHSRSFIIWTKGNQRISSHESVFLLRRTCFHVFTAPGSAIFCSYWIRMKFKSTFELLSLLEGLWRPLWSCFQVAEIVNRLPAEEKKI